MTWNSMLGGHLQSKAQLEERAKSGEGLRSLFGKEQTPREAKASEVVEAIANELSTSLTAGTLVQLATCSVSPTDGIVPSRARVRHAQVCLSCANCRWSKSVPP